MNSEKQKTNLPNKLSLLRLCLVPVFTVVYFLSIIPDGYNFLVSAIIFALAAMTDFLDGYIARKDNLVTDLGKFLDPIADKILVSTAFVIMLVPVGDHIAILPWYAAVGVAVILARELIVSVFRMVAASKGAVIAADKSGKLKTILQDLGILILLIGAFVTNERYAVINIVALVIFWLAVLLTIISGAECIIKNRAVLKAEPQANGEKTSQTVAEQQSQQQGTQTEAVTEIKQEENADNVEIVAEQKAKRGRPRKDEVRTPVEKPKKSAKPKTKAKAKPKASPKATGARTVGVKMPEKEAEELFLKAIASGIKTGNVSITQLQRRLQIGYSRAGGFIDKMERMGYITPAEENKAREVLITKEQFEEKYGRKVEDLLRTEE